MADHVSCAGYSLVEERKEVMHPPSSGNPILRKAHFLKPISKEHHKHLPPPPSSLFSSIGFSLSSHKGHSFTLGKLKKHRLRSYKGHSSETWKIWVNSLKPKYQETWKRAGIFEAIMASIYTFPTDRNLILGLAERWCPETSTFIFPWGEVTFTLEDVIFLGGYSVLGDSFSTPLADEFSDIINCLKNVHVRFGRGRGNVRTSVWMKHYMCRGDELEHEAFLAMWLSKFVFVCSCDHIAVHDFYVAVHLSRGARIALAPVVLASIYRDMRLLHNSIVESVEVEDVVGLSFFLQHYDLVQMWAWERFPELRPTPSVMEKGEPRSARWNGVKIIKGKDVRAALDSAKESFMWRPYSTTSSDCMLSNLYRDNEQWVVVESDDKESFARCLRVSELVGLGCIEQYLPHRVAMQFGFDQDVPRYVIRSNQTPETAWSSYNRSTRGVKLYIPPRHFEPDISSRYVVWWRGLLVGNEGAGTNCIQNEKQLPLVSRGQKRDAAFLTDTDCLSGCAAERPEDTFPIDQLTSRSGKTKSSGRRNDHEPALNAFSRLEAPTKVICMSEPAGHLLAVNEEMVTSFIQSGKHSPLVSCGHRRGAKSLTTPGCLSGCAEVRQEDVEEDSLTIAQLLSRSRKIESSGKRNDLDHEPVLNIYSKTETPTKSIFMTEPVGSSVQSLSSSDKCKNGESPAERQKEPELATEEVAIIANNVNIEEESYENTTSAYELPQLGLESRIWRLEAIVEMIKAQKLVAGSREV